MPWTKTPTNGEDCANTAGKTGGRTLSYREALLEAQKQLLQSDPSVYLIGQGIDDPDGVFGSTAGLAEIFGKTRVLDTPIAENGMTGIAIGSAIAGMRPVFIHMRSDFLPMCADQIINHAAKWRYMTGGGISVPIVIRSIIGRGWGSAAQHAQALHSLFCHIPGLKVCLPATPYDAKGMLIKASRDGGPVMFFEHRWLYDSRGPVPEAMYEVDFGRAAVRRKGRDITIAAVSLLVREALKAARELEKEGIDAEIIDPRTLKPLDIDSIANSVKKTGRLLLCDNATIAFGASAEIAAAVCEKAFFRLKAPPARIGFPDCPVPASPALEELYYPGAAEIAAAARELMKYSK